MVGLTHLSPFTSVFAQQGLQICTTMPSLTERTLRYLIVTDKKMGQYKKNVRRNMDVKAIFVEDSRK
jgi:hypothetical protein